MLMQRRKNENTTATIAADAVVCEEATLEGSITIGPRCIVHPKATIIAKDGPIVIGESNLIEEQTKIINRNLPGTEGNSPLIIGDNNLFEVGSEFEGKFIGSNNVLEAKGWTFDDFIEWVHGWILCPLECSREAARQHSDMREGILETACERQTGASRSAAGLLEEDPAQLPLSHKKQETCMTS
ncbi:dynactin subunit 6-like isoform X1 [Clavelina lepadiformis]|uniref:dynactin subunit 6-like isoform X1 n=1 Tax=Clavelina lepadiformis TaxID=159417 RepID=UPI0040418225